MPEAALSWAEGGRTAGAGLEGILGSDHFMQHWEREGQGVNLAEWDNSQSAALRFAQPEADLWLPAQRASSPKVTGSEHGRLKALCQTWKVYHPHPTCG